jgi:hypothetical protein
LQRTAIEGKEADVGGLAMLAVVGLYLAVAIWLVVKSPGWWRLVALLAVVLIPTADALWGRYVTLPRLCKDAGLKVYAKATKDGGLLFDGAADDYYIVKYGFPYVEGQDAAGTYYRFSRIEGQEKAVFERSVQPRAKYVSRAVQLNPLPTFAGTAYLLEERATGKPLGELVTYAYLGGWAERFLGGFADSGPGYAGGCDVSTFTREALLKAVFDLGG